METGKILWPQLNLSVRDSTTAARQCPGQLGPYLPSIRKRRGFSQSLVGEVDGVDAFAVFTLELVKGKSHHSTKESSTV